MSFSNKNMKQKHRHLTAPHIAKIDGWWRVSPKPFCVPGSPHWERWNDAYDFVTEKNSQIIGEHIRL